MKSRFALLRPAGRIGLATIGVIVFGIFILGISLATAQKEDAAAGKIKKTTYAALAEAPEKARERKNPFEGDTQAVAAGGKLFEQHCADCHGRKAAGAKKGPSLLREEVQQATPGTLFWILTNGVVRRGMPVWSKLPEQQRWQIVTFLQSLKLQSLNSQSENDKVGNPVP
ncbi:MAG: c-type cytochrome [Terriglobales bacterium]